MAVGGGSSSVGSGSSNYASSGSCGGGFDPLALGAALAVLLVVIFVALAVSIALSIFVFWPLEVSCQRFFISARTAPGDINLLGFAFKNSYGNVIKVQFFRWLYTFLWTLLLFVPGIIKGYEYRMIPFLLAEDPTMDKDEAFARSREMMTGHKWNAFVLDLSFLGWHILGVFTCGLLQVFYINPYQQLTNAELYEALR
jgi:uncharacterized membrane protein